MATGDRIARGQITIIDLNDSTSINAYITANQATTQIYSKDTGSYSPNWTSSPYLVLTPSVYMSGDTTNQIGVTGRIKAGSVKWYKDGAALSNTSGVTEFSTTTAPYALTIKQNQLSDATTVRYRFEATFIDPRTDLELAFTSDITFARIDNAGALICAIGYTPDGSVFQNASPSSLSIHCDLWRGNTIDNTNVTYKWGIKKAGVFSPKSAGAAAEASQKVVTFNDVTNVIAGSLVTIGSASYVVSSVNSSTKAVTMTSNLTAAITSGTAISCPEYDADLGLNWGIINATYTRDGITGYSTNEISVPDAAVLNYETFQCAIKDTDTTSATANSVVSDFISLSDLSDPITIDISAPAGNIIKNGEGSVELTAKVWRSGEEIDATGSTYSYKWNKYDSNGNPESETRATKTITVQASEVSSKATFECELISK
ncbi:MAG: hypothetical protein R3Y65_09200 [Bacillota bacterium]